MRGLETLVKFGIMSEKKWDARGYDFSEMAKAFSNADQEVIRSLNRVADGELTGIGMLFRLYDLCMRDATLLPSFYETILYTAYTVIYEEFRHGLVLKELNNVVAGQPSFIKEASADELVKDYILVKQVWDSPYEVLVSFMVGEISNSALYREAAKKADHPVLKELLMNISKDEYRHKTAWRAISKRLVDDSADNRERFIAAYRKAHCVHQAEVGRHYSQGLMDTQQFFTAPVVEEIFQDKVSLLKDIVGDDLGFDVQEFASTQMRHIASLFND